MNTRVDQPDPESKPADSFQTDTSDGHEYEEVLDLIGFGRVQWCVLLSSGLLFMMVISETMGMSYITIVSQCEFETSSIDKVVMSAACFIVRLSFLGDFLNFTANFLSDCILGKS